MGAPAVAELVDEAVAAVDQLLEKPEWLLDPGSEEAQGAAKQARGLMKRFFDEVRSQRSGNTDVLGAKLGGSLQSLVVEGFDRHQIWEELEVQNKPLRRHLQRLLPKFAAAPKHALDFSLEARGVQQGGDEEPERASQKRRAKPSARRRAAKEEEDDEDEEPGEVAAEADGDAQPEAPDDGGAEEAEEEAGEDFFDAQEMERFTTLGDQGKLRLDPDAGDSDFDDIEADEDGEDGAEEAKNARFEDFYLPSRGRSGSTGKKAKKTSSKPPSKKEAVKAKKKEEVEGEDEEEEEQEIEGEEAEEEEEELEDDDESGLEDNIELKKLSGEERELEKQLRALEARGLPESDDEEDEKEDEDEEDDDEGMEGAESEDGEDGKEKKPKKKGKSLYEMDKRLRALEEEVAKLEEEQLEAKPWTLQGEVSAKERPLNSLLEVHLDQPMTHFAGRRAEDAAIAAGPAAEEDDDALEDVAGGGGLAKKQHGIDIEAIIRGRVWDELFDDVVRRTAVPPSQRKADAEDDTVETLNFEKSRVGLGEVYSKQYETQMLGHATDAQKQQDEERAEMRDLFAVVVFQLDALTNMHFTPRPVTLGASGQEIGKLGSLQVEEKIPLLASDEMLKAPEEMRAPQRHARGREELTHDERVASRRNKKAMRKKNLDRRVESGELTLKGRRERDEKLSTKNKEAKEARGRKGEVKEQKKRLKASELLEQAALNASNHASRKDEARRERQKKPASTQNSKRLKL